MTSHWQPVMPLSGGQSPQGAGAAATLLPGAWSDLPVAIFTMTSALGLILSVNRRGQQPNTSRPASSTTNGTRRQGVASVTPAHLFEWPVQHAARGPQH